MASAVWSALEGPSSILSGATDPGTLLNQQLASALSTMGGDAQYWEDSMSPATIKQSLDAEPSNTPVLLKGMKWLLACMSKGQQVSEYFSQVVKLVGAQNLEVRKMVYMYLVQYANYNATTRELSLLSINAFQRGMADNEALIRALALRALTSIHINDILQIQILGVQKCARDPSPYVRKCAANALSKLHPRCENSQKEILQTVMVNLLEQDTITMVLSSALVAFAELCPDQLHLLHKSFYKICHLLTDFDEWGQVVILELLARYCRTYFRKPPSVGSAEAIDSERRVRRTVDGITNLGHNNRHNSHNNGSDSPQKHLTIADKASQSGTLLPARHTNGNKTKRPTVKKGFYSDDEDDSSEDDETPLQSIPTLPALRQNNGNTAVAAPTLHSNLLVAEDAGLAADHQRLLQASMPLLKSRNSGVVLAVCSLHYYCGVASIPVRASMGKALVRIHRDCREIQYVVLMAIKTLVLECPSAFSPFLPEFFIKAMDSPFTRLIKLDIITSLALDPSSLEMVLKELRTYLYNGDSTFVCAVLDAIGRIVEQARIVHDRHGRKSGNTVKERADANTLALNCLFGLVTFSQASEKSRVVGKSVCIMQRILQMLWSDVVTGHGDLMSVQDPNKVQQRAIRRILLLLVNTLSERVKKDDAEENVDDEDDNDDVTNLQRISLVLPPIAVASAIWIIGECLVSTNDEKSYFGRTDSPAIGLEILRLISRSFPFLTPPEKLQGVCLAIKLVLSASQKGSNGLGNSDGEVAVCEHILAMGRVDTNIDVRDRSRFYSGVIRTSIGLQYDLDNMDDVPSFNQPFTVDMARRMFIQHKPAPSSLPLQDTSSSKNGQAGGFRFGTLSSLVGHQARSAYHPLPPWSKENSPDSLRQPAETKSTLPTSQTLEASKDANKNGFYADADSDSSSSDSSSSSSDSNSSSGSSSDDDSSVSSSDDSDASKSSNSTSLLGSSKIVTNSSKQNGNNNNLNIQQPVSYLEQQQQQQTLLSNGASKSKKPQVVVKSVVDESDDSSASDSSESSDSSDDSGANAGPSTGNLLSLNFVQPEKLDKSYNISAAANDFSGMTLAPVPTSSSSTAGNPDAERDSSNWHLLVRPEHANGLSVQARFLRGTTKAKEAQLLGLSADSPTLLCLQLRMENIAGTSPVRRLRILQRSSGSSSSSQINPRKIVLPPEIATLNAGQQTNCILAIDFASTSDRDGALVAKLEIKSSAGGIPVEIKPSLADVLLPFQQPLDDFDQGMKGLQGFQRVESVIKITSKSICDRISAQVMKHAALTPIGNVGKDNLWRFAGKLPASFSPVYVSVNLIAGSDEGKLIVCSENAMAVNSILVTLKKAIQELK